MATRNLAVAGLALTGAMQVVFLATGADRGMLYEAVQALSVLSTAAAVWGLRGLPRGAALGALTAGLAGNALCRVLTLALGLSRLPVWLNVLMLAGYVLATYEAARWANHPGRGDDARAAGIRRAFALLGFVYFMALLRGVSNGRWAAIAGLALGAIGFALAAPYVEAPKPLASRAGATDEPA